MALALYAVTALVLLALAHRFVRPVSHVAAAILFLLPFVFTGHALLTSRVYAPADLPYATEPFNTMKEEYGIGEGHNGSLSDLSSQMMPWRKAVQWSLARGEWPLWNPFILSGDILAASGQSAPYSPFTLLALLLPVPVGMTFSASLAHFLAALGAFLFARELDCREAAALIAAAGWTCATALAFFILWPLGFAWTFLPFVLLGLRRASAGMLIAAFTLLLLAGHPETALHVVFIAGIYALFLRNVRAIVAATIAGLTALALCAIFILPILEAAPQTMEHATRTGVFAETPRGAPARQVAARLATDAFPYLYMRKWTFGQTPADAAAPGSIVLALALFAIWRVRSAESWFFAALALFGLLAHAEWTPVARTLQQLPLFDAALNERFSFAAAFALATLAAMAVEQLCRDRSGRAAAITLAAVLIVLAAGNALLLRTGVVSHEPLAWGRYTIAAELLGLALAALFAWRRAPHLLLGVLLLQRALTAGGFYPTLDARAAYPPVPLLASTRTAQSPFRIVGHGYAFLPGTSALYEVEDVRGYQAMTFLRYRETYPLWCEHQPVWFNRVDDLTRPFLSFLNVRYAITWDREPPPPGWREVARQRGALLVENGNAFERIFVPRRVRVGVPRYDAIGEMQRENDFRERAWIEAAAPAPYERENGPGEVTFARTSPGEYAIDVRMARDGWIVASLPHWKGWRAYLDGRRVATQFANHAFIGIHVPAGAHRVRLVYRPDAFVIGRWISLVTLAMLIAFTTARVIRSRRASSRAR